MAWRPLRMERSEPTLTIKGLGNPASIAAAINATVLRSALSSPARITASCFLPFSIKYLATARPISAWEKPISMSIGVGVKSQVSTTGIPAAIKRVRPLPGCITPVKNIPSGRRPITESNRSSSRSAEYADCPSIN